MKRPRAARQGRLRGKVAVVTGGSRGIGLLPGATATDIWEQFWPGAPRSRMISPADVAAVVVEAVVLPAGTTVEELVIAPTRGAL